CKDTSRNPDLGRRQRWARCHRRSGTCPRTDSSPRSQPSEESRDLAGHHEPVCERGHWSELGEQELVAGAAWTAQSEPTEPENSLEVGEQHLDLLATVP